MNSITKEYTSSDIHKMIEEELEFAPSKSTLISYINRLKDVIDAKEGSSLDCFRASGKSFIITEKGYSLLKTYIEENYTPSNSGRPAGSVSKLNKNNSSESTSRVSAPDQENSNIIINNALITRLEKELELSRIANKALKDDFEDRLKILKVEKNDELEKLKIEKNAEIEELKFDISDIRTKYDNMLKHNHQLTVRNNNQRLRIMSSEKGLNLNKIIKEDGSVDQDLFNNQNNNQNNNTGDSNPIHVQPKEVLKPKNPEFEEKQIVDVKSKVVDDKEVNNTSSNEEIPVDSPKTKLPKIKEDTEVKNNIDHESSQKEEPSKPLGRLDALKILLFGKK